MNKDFLFSDNSVKTMSFDELYEEFIQLIHSESWKFYKRYNGKINKDEIDQQFIIELWNAFDKYDISKGVCISTYIVHRIKKGKRDLQYLHFLSLPSRYEKENVVIKLNSYTDKDGGEESGRDYSEKIINEQYVNAYDEMLKIPELSFMEGELFNLIKKRFERPEDFDLIYIMLDKKGFSVVDYAKKYGITRQAANQRLLKIKQELRKILTKEWL